MTRQQAKSKANAKSQSPSSDVGEAPSNDRLRAVLLAGLVAVYVARPLLPSEAPATVAGDGLPFVMLSLILAAAWSLAQAMQSRARVRWGVVEWAWFALLVWQAVSTYRATRFGFGRAAINMFWEWVGLGVGYFLLRQLLRGEREKRALIVVMIGLALVLSLDGIHQYFVEMPAVREYYRSHADTALRELGIHAPPGSAARQLFEERLKSTEPTATFALANSLAGFLTPWLLLAVAVVWLEQGSSAGWQRQASGAVCALPIALCLVQTKSRAAYLAGLAAFAAMLFLRRQSGRRTGRIAAGAVAVAVLLAAAAFAAGALDRQVVTQALMSLSYRWHYWQGAIGMIEEHPWFGCGPGNFQDEYTRYKLPQASEVVADPHNFLFEIWATSGTPAAIALLAMLVGAAREWRRASSRLRLEGPWGDLPMSSADGGLFRQPNVAPLAGGMAGLLLALAVGQFATVSLPWSVLLAGLVVLPLTAAAFSAWVATGQTPVHAPFLCALALLINLSAAGGIGFAGVAGSLWLLLAIGASSSESPGHRLAAARAAASTFPPGPANYSLCVALAALLAACYLTAYRPVLACRSLLDQAERDSAGARRRLLAATEADWWADEPWRQLAAADFDLWRRQQTATRSADWERDQQELLLRRPHSSAAWLEAGERYFTAYRESHGDHRRKYLSAAVDHFQRAAELYPNYPLAHAELALALAAGHRPQASKEADQALRLHEQTPHLDQKLPPALFEAVKQITRTTDRPAT